MIDPIYDPNQISQTLETHYSNSFRQAGAVPMGVEHRNLYFAELSYAKALAILTYRPPHMPAKPSLLDVGSGYGGLFAYATQKGIALNYTGIELSTEMVDHARNQYKPARFETGDFFNWEPEILFDYIICNGGLTQKLDHSIQEMEIYSRALIRRMYRFCRIGIAFNMMPNTVNYMKPNLFYKSAVEMLAFLQTDLSPDVVIDHAYTPFNYYCYVFRPRSWTEFETLRDMPDRPDTL